MILVVASKADTVQDHKLTKKTKTKQKRSTTQIILLLPEFV